MALEPWIKRDTRDAWIMVFPVVVILFNQFSLATSFARVFPGRSYMDRGMHDGEQRGGNLSVLYTAVFHCRTGQDRATTRGSIGRRGPLEVKDARPDKAPPLSTSNIPPEVSWLLI